MEAKPKKLLKKKATIKPASLMAQAVAHEVVDKVAKGSKISLAKIMQKHGYSAKTARAPSKVTKQKAFKDIVDPFGAKLIKQRDAILRDISDTNRRKRAKWIDLVNGMDKVIKNIELLAGRATERFEGLTEEERAGMDKLLKLNKQ